MQLLLECQSMRAENQYCSAIVKRKTTDRLTSKNPKVQSPAVACLEKHSVKQDFYRFISPGSQLITNPGRISRKHVVDYYEDIF